MDSRLGSTDTFAVLDFNQITTFGQLRERLPSTGTHRVLGIRQLQEKASVVLRSKAENGFVEIYDNGFFTYSEGRQMTVFGVDRCSLLKWYSCTGEVLSSEGANLDSLPWIMPLEIVGMGRLDHNRYNRQKNKEKYAQYMPETKAKLYVLPEHDRKEMEAENRQFWNNNIQAMKAAEKLLTEKQMQVLQMAHLEKLTQNQIAERMGLSRATIREHLASAEKKIKKYFKNTRHFTP